MTTNTNNKCQWRFWTREEQFVVLKYDQWKLEINSCTNHKRECPSLCLLLSFYTFDRTPPAYTRQRETESKVQSLLVWTSLFAICCLIYNRHDTGPHPLVLALPHIQSEHLCRPSTHSIKNKHNRWSISSACSLRWANPTDSTLHVYCPTPSTIGAACRTPHGHTINSQLY